MADETEPTYRGFAVDDKIEITIGGIKLNPKNFATLEQVTINIRLDAPGPPDGYDQNRICRICNSTVWEGYVKCTECGGDDRFEPPISIPERMRL